MNVLRKLKNVASRLESTTPLLAIVAISVTCCARADDIVYETVWSQNFDTPNYITTSDYTNWKIKLDINEREGITTEGNGVNVAQATYQDETGTDNQCFQTTSAGSGGAVTGCSYSFPSAFFEGSGVTDYIFGFDVFMSNGYTSNASNLGETTDSVITLKGASGDLVVIHIPAPGASNIKDKDGSAKVYLAKDWSNPASGYWSGCVPSADNMLTRKRGGLCTSGLQYWHHITIAGSEDSGLYVTIARRDDPTIKVLDNVRVCDFTSIKSLSLIEKRGNVNATRAFDNFELKTPKDTTLPESPTFSGDGDGREKVNVSLSCATEGATIYYWLGEGREDTKQIYDDTPIVLDESNTVFAYSENNGKVSRVVSQYFYSNLQAIQLNAPLVSRRGFEMVYISASQSSVFGTPTPVINYKGGSMEQFATVEAGDTAYVTIEGLDGNSTIVQAMVTEARYGTSDTTTLNLLSKDIEGYQIIDQIDYVDLFANSSGSVTWGTDTTTSPLTYESGKSTYQKLLFNGNSLSCDKVEIWYGQANYSSGAPRWEYQRNDGLTTVNIGDAGVLLLRALKKGALVYINTSSNVRFLQNLVEKTNNGNEYVYEVIENGDATFQVTKNRSGYQNNSVYAIRIYQPIIARVNNTGYTSLSEAFNDAESASITSITLLDASITDTDVAALSDYWFLENGTLKKFDSVKWVGGTTTDNKELISTPANWYPNRVPSGDKYYVSFDGGAAGKTVTFDSMMSLAKSVWVGNGSESAVTWKSSDGSTANGMSQTQWVDIRIADGNDQAGNLAIDSGLYHAMNDIKMASGSNSSATLTLDGGRVETAYWLTMGAGEKSVATIEINNNAELIVGYRDNTEANNAHLRLSEGKDSSATITINKGRMRADTVEVAYYDSGNGNTGTGGIDIASQGTLEVSGGINLSRGTNASGTINLNGGILKVGYLCNVYNMAADQYVTSKAWGRGSLNLNSGTIKPIAANENFIPAPNGNESRFTIALNSVVIDTGDNKAITIGAKVIAAENVTTPSLTKKGTGLLTFSQSLPNNTIITVAEYADGVVVPTGTYIAGSNTKVDTTYTEEGKIKYIHSQPAGFLLEVF